ncbi:MAG: glutathione S-transferase C-terminal domain-containing protein [Deltaproteobacteria bacterium]|nr:glutathione S-transferase C-terminal domain-containing protein [Deltaproteobacteria bacterium]
MRYAIWGSELSPFTLKLRALMTAAAVPFRNLPEEGTRAENLRAQWRLARGKRRRTIERWPHLDALDEYPLVPFLFEDDTRILYDSSALAAWLDRFHPSRRGALVPDDAALAFVTQLIDEAFDELGLYLVHHARWVVSATTNDAGQRLAREFARVLPPGGQGAMARQFARRQVRRLPYLFSVAPPDLHVDGLPPALIPPARDGFPPTHALLEEIWHAVLDAVEGVLAHQPFLLGERFTLADASVYGELGMNLKDPTAAELMRRRAPHTFRWLCEVRDGAHATRSGTLGLHERLRPLLELLERTFVPLMVQNAAAHERARAAGETRFNEPAFNAGRALYDGTLLGRPYRSVVKTFQVRVWRDLQALWQGLDPAARERVRRVAEIAW